MENVRKKMGAFLDGKIDLCAYFNDCVDNSYNIEEFEMKWQAMLDKHGLHGDERFENLYKIKNDWMPAFLWTNSSHSSKQRSEVRGSMLC
jgi:hypothetical protein